MLRDNLSDGTAIVEKTFPYLPETPRLIWDEDSTMYIIGGQQYPGNFIIKYDLERLSDIHFIEVKMYPGKNIRRGCLNLYWYFVATEI